MGISEIILIAIVVLLIWAVGNFGKDTSLGVWGSIGLAVITTPVVAFLIISVFFKGRKKGLTKIYQSPFKNRDY